MVSFDLDAVSEAEAPGVSAPNAAGLSSDLWIEAAYQAGRSAAVSSVDIVELNPQVDRDGQTARLAAVTVWWLLCGRSERR
jgi:formiminoglutamase